MLVRVWPGASALGGRVIGVVARDGSKARSRRAQRRGRASWLCALGAALLASVARASEPGSRCPEPSALALAGSTAGAASSAGATDVSRLFTEYQCWLEAGDYRLALRVLERACGGSDDPACPFNRALVHHAWLEVPDELEPEHCRVARQNYALYLARDPYDEQSDAARAALDELQRICPPEPALAMSVAYTAPEAIAPVDPNAPAPAEHDATAPLAQTGPAPAALEAYPRRTLPWLLMGAGSASAVAAVVSGINMSRADADLARHARAGVVYRTRETRALDASRRRHRDWALGLGAGAVVLLGAGTTLWLLDSNAASRMTVGVAPGLATIGIDGAF